MLRLLNFTTARAQAETRTYRSLPSSNNAAHMFSVMYDLPDDVLMQVFWWTTYETMVTATGELTASPTLTDHVDSSDPLGARWVIPLVCRRWNAVSRVYLAMWRHIYLVLPSEADMVLRRSPCRSKEDYARRWKTRVDQLLARSSSLELFVNIRTNVASLEEFGAFRHVFLQCIVNSVNRWNSLRIAGKSSTINALLSSLDFRKLVSLNVLVTEQSTGQTITVFQNAPKIQCLEISIARWDKRIPTRHLCHVSVPSGKVEHLSAWSHPGMRIHAMKNLVTLHLFFLSPQTVPRINTHVTLYTVQDMSLAENTFASGAMSAFMKLFHTPELRRLRLAFGRPPNQWDHVEIPTLPYSLRRLESLIIDCFHGHACLMSSDKFRQFLDKTKEVKTLQFDTNMESYISSALASGYLPRLKKIVLADPQWRIFHRLLNHIVNLRGGKISLEYRF